MHQCGPSSCRSPELLLTVLIVVAFYFAVSQPSSAIEIHADPEVIVENGTAAILRCTFTSSEVVQSTTTVTWSFQSNQPDSKFFKSPYVVSRPTNCPFCTAGFPQHQDNFLRLCHLHRHMKKCSGSRRAPTQVPFFDNLSRLLPFELCIFATLILKFFFFVFFFNPPPVFSVDLLPVFVMH